MNILHAVIFGIVEGVTEFLPISSTGHLILTGKLLGLPSSEFLKSFEIVIQLGAILAVVVSYSKSLLAKPEVWKKVLAAFIPTAILGLAVYKIVKKVFLGNEQVVLWALFLGGILLIIFDRIYREGPDAEDDIARMPYKTAILIGCVQSLALIPGVSRSAATIIGGLILGMKKKAIVEFSFLLAIPTMLAATALDVIKNTQVFSSQQLPFLAVGFLTSFVVAVLSIKFLLHYIQRHGFLAFGVYRVIAPLLFWFILGK